MASTPPGARLGYHASHEQFSPRRLLEWARVAEQAGFRSLFSSDHFHPWGTLQGQSGFSFAWLGAALQATQLPARVICCPCGRYHPAIVAQAAATLEEMFPGRFGLALGSGQALNEHITGERWLTKPERHQRLLASAEIIRSLWRGETVTRPGPVRIEDATLYTRPAMPPPLFGAAITDATAEWVGGWADGLLTTARPPPESDQITAAFVKGGGTGKPRWLKVGLSYIREPGNSAAQAHREWRNAAFPNSILTEIRTTAQFDELGQRVRPEDMSSVLRISDDLDQHIAWLKGDVAAGFTEIFLHNVGPNQEEFIADFGRHVLPLFD